MRFHSGILVAAVTVGSAPPGLADHVTEELSEVVVTARVWEAAAGAAVLTLDGTVQTPYGPASARER